MAAKNNGTAAGGAAGPSNEGARDGDQNNALRVSAKEQISKLRTREMKQILIENNVNDCSEKSDVVVKIVRLGWKTLKKGANILGFSNSGAENHTDNISRKCVCEKCYLNPTNHELEECHHHCTTCEISQKRETISTNKKPIADTETRSTENEKTENIDSYEAVTADEEYPTRAKEIVKLEGDKYRFNHEALKRIIEGNNIAEHIIAIISVNGNTRTGKSFLLNFFIRYFPNEFQQSRYLDGFISKNGSKAVTLGIWIWPEPLLRKDKEGRDVAVLLMDTQGLFDDQTSLGGNDILFYLSCMLSTVFIYNIKELLTSDKLQFLDSFSSSVEQNVSKVKPGNTEGTFPILVFALRDWTSVKDFKWGMHYSKNQNNSSGVEFHPDQNNYLKHMFSGEKSAECKRALDAINNLFPSIECCLLPHPGCDVSESEETIEILKIRDIFFQPVEELVERQIENAVCNCSKRFTGTEILNYVERIRNAYIGSKTHSIKEVRMNLELQLLATEKISIYDDMFSRSKLINMHIDKIVEQHSTLNNTFWQDFDMVCKTYQCDSKSNELIVDFLKDIYIRFITNLNERLKHHNEMLSKTFNDLVFKEDSADYIKELKEVILKSFKETTQTVSERKIVETYYDLLNVSLKKCLQLHLQCQNEYFQQIKEFYEWLTIEQVKVVNRVSNNLGEQKHTEAEFKEVNENFKKTIEEKFDEITVSFEKSHNQDEKEISEKYLQKFKDYFSKQLSDNIMLMYDIQLDSVRKYFSETGCTIEIHSFDSFLKTNTDFLLECRQIFNGRISIINNKELEKAQRNISVTVLENALVKQCKSRNNFNSNRLWIVKLVRLIFYSENPKLAVRKAKEKFKNSRED